MASYTPNYNLKKPAGTDVVDIDDLNGNMDIIDTQLNSLNSKLIPHLVSGVTTYGTIDGGAVVQIGRIVIVNLRLNGNFTANSEILTGLPLPTYVPQIAGLGVGTVASNKDMHLTLMKSTVNESVAAIYTLDAFSGAVSISITYCSFD